jgi:acid stress-induced BolA-like protein IbaG/YrbA
MNLVESHVKRLMESGLYFTGVILHGDAKSLKIWEIRNLYRIKQAIEVFKWLLIRRKLKSFEIHGINIYEIMVRNWRRLEKELI